MVAATRRIAYFSPLPFERSGIADYSAELLPYLAQYAEITLFASGAAQVDPGLQSAFAVLPLADFSRLSWRYDIALYQMGDSMAHDGIYETLLRYPGIVVLHDHGLHHFIATRTIPRDRFAEYARELGYAHGTAGVTLAYQIRQGYREHPFYEMPLNERVLDHSLALIVHSRYVAERILSVRPMAHVHIIPAPIRTVDPSSLRTRQGLGHDDATLLFVCAGQVIRIKQIELVLKAFARLLDGFPTARLVVVGDDSGPDSDIGRLLHERGLEGVVHRTGYLADMQEFCAWIEAADVLINLRYPTVGETSATALRGMAAGRPVIVSDHGWYAEIPDRCCVKVQPNDANALYEAMHRLAADESLRAAVGRTAAEYVCTAHDLPSAAAGYWQVIDRVSGHYRST